MFVLIPGGALESQKFSVQFRRVVDAMVAFETFDEGFEHGELVFVVVGSTIAQVSKILAE
jgi:hypothetical protein